MGVEFLLFLPFFAQVISCVFFLYSQKTCFAMKSIQAIICTLIFGSLALTCLQGTAWAGYKPVDVSDIQGEQRKQLAELARNVGRMPAQSRDAFLCEQLGLCFAADGSKVMGHDKGPNTAASKAFFVGRSGRPLPFMQAYKGTPVWSKCYDKNVPIDQTKPGALLSFFKKDVDRVVHNTAKYLMNEMPEDLRWSLLAILDKKLYYQDGRSASEKKYEFSLECGIKVSYYGEESFQNSYFVGANGEEAKVGDTRRKEGRWERYNRWYCIVKRCANLVGDKDILALFPEEVKAMRKHYKQRLAQVKEQQGEANKALLTAADEMLASLPNEDLKYAKIAAAVGLYFEDHASTGYNYTYGWLNPSVKIFLPNGKKLTGRDNLVNGTNPGILQQIPHEAILEHYREPITQMARHIAEDRFKEMPPIVRDLMRAELSGNLINADGSPAQDLGGGYSTIETHNRTWKIPVIGVDKSKTFFVDSKGRKLPYSVFDQYIGSYGQTFRLIHLCDLILGRDEVLKYIPPAGENEGKELPQAPQKSAMGSATNEPAPAPAEKPKTPQKSAMGSTSLEDAASPKDAQYAEGVAALRRMPTALRRAWLAENMGFCYTQSNAPAYLAPHVANDNALFVDEQGKERKLSEVATDKMASDWVAATKAALAVGHEQVAMPFKEELKALAVQTATYILNAIGETPRFSWLAEMNHLIFKPNGQSAYPPNERSLSVEGGFKVQSAGISYGGTLFYNPQGKITQPAMGNTGGSRWLMLFRCANVAGIEAINAAFKANVDAMRSAYEKSPFYKK